MTTPTTLLALALSLAIAGPGSGVALAADALPGDLPPYGADRPLPVPDITRRTLANGLEVWVVPRDGIPRVDYVLAVRNAGFAVDAPATPGFASLFASLLPEGTGRRDSRAIAEAAQGHGGSVSASASTDGVIVTADALAPHAAPMLALLAEVVRTPAFPEEEVALGRANALQALKAAEAQPAFKATRALRRAIYGAHPYARTQQTEASIEGVTAAVLRAEHARRFQPDRALLVITGRIAPDEALRLAESTFGDWTAAGTEVPATPPVPADATPRRVLVQRDGSVQSTIRLGSPAIAATGDDYVPLQLAGTVLGGSFSSRVMQNLREQKGYTYGASTTLVAARMGGHVQGGADVRNEVTGASLKEFFGEFERLGSGPVPATELDDTKRYVAGSYLIGNQMQGAVAATLASQWLAGLPAEFLGQYVPKIRAVDAAQVQAMARKYYDPARQSIVVVGDGAAIADQLAPYGEFSRAE